MLSGPSSPSPQLRRCSHSCPPVSRADSPISDLSSFPSPKTPVQNCFILKVSSKNQAHTMKAFPLSFCKHFCQFSSYISNYFPSSFFSPGIIQKCINYDPLKIEFMIYFLDSQIYLLLLWSLFFGFATPSFSSSHIPCPFTYFPDLESHHYPNWKCIVSAWVFFTIHRYKNLFTVAPKCFPFFA